MGKVKKWFLSGIVVILPAGVTAYVFTRLFGLLDGLLSPLILRAFGRNIPGIGLLLFILSILLFGMLASHWLGSRVVKWFQNTVFRIPLIKSIYKPVHKMISSLSDDKTRSFQKVVILEFPVKGAQSIGFITNDHVQLDEQEKVCVFIPTTPNPTNGFLIIKDRKELKKADMTVSEGLNAVISIGSLINSPIKTRSLE